MLKSDCVALQHAVAMHDAIFFFFFAKSLPQLQSRLPPLMFVGDCDLL